MPRQAREKSESGYYHIIKRGNNKQKIFISSGDRDKYLSLLARQVEDNKITVIAYCLMDNHIHLLLKEFGNELVASMHSIGTSYARYFNKKYDRVGHLFQNRYKSESIKDDAYLFSALRYIHQNPVNAGICENVEDYPWSSDRHYRLQYSDTFVDTDILAFLSESREIAMFEYCRLMEIREKESFAEIDVPAKSSLEISLVVRNELQKRGIEDVRNKENRKMLKDMVCSLHDKHGLSLRQIASELKISKGMIQNLLKR